MGVYALHLLKTCFLWRDSPTQDIQTFKLDTETYVSKPASFLAIRAMSRLAVNEVDSYPLGFAVFLRDFYVDDMISGGNSVPEVLDAMHQTSILFKIGSFRIRKWFTIHLSFCVMSPKYDDGTNVTKTLGLVWEPHRDNFLLKFARHIGSWRHTKRKVLSTIARCYDPLGIVGPTKRQN